MKSRVWGAEKTPKRSKTPKNKGRQFDGRNGLLCIQTSQEDRIWNKREEKIEKGDRVKITRKRGE
jgi:hypothetical protein